MSRLRWEAYKREVVARQVAEDFLLSIIALGGAFGMICAAIQMMR